MNFNLLTSLVLGTGLLVFYISAEDWSGWRGPDGLGVSADRGFPLEWSKTLNVKWIAEVAGKGASSPVAVGDRVYLTSQTADTGLHVIAFDRKSGSLVWDREIGKGKARTHQFHNMATPTPVADDRNVWAIFGTGDLVCLDASGKEVWKRQLAQE